MSRLIIVSNRVSAPSAVGEETVGGLAMALAAALRQYSGLWFGWSGKTTEKFTGPCTRLFSSNGIKIVFEVSPLAKVNVPAV